MGKHPLGWQSWSPPAHRTKWFGPSWDHNPLIEARHRQYRSGKKTKKSSIRYWCSWYAYSTSINHKKITQTLKLIQKHRLPFTHILIDDGWTTWGDWHTPDPKKFPNFKRVINNIKAKNLQVGIWCAPFLANNYSNLYKEHPEWFVQYKGKPIQGFKTYAWIEPFIPQQYLLNFSLKAVRQYITSWIDKVVVDWGAALLKLDFLYAPYFNPRVKNDQVPHAQVEWLLHYIKKNYPHVHIVACGAPFAPTLGLAHTIRISKDTITPPNFPKLVNVLMYNRRIKFLLEKYKVIPAQFDANIDPDVRMFTHDNVLTNRIWDTISTSVIGVGDDLTLLKGETLELVKKWLSRHRTLHIT